MIKGFTSLDRIKSEFEFSKLMELAREDNHGVYCPTHVIRRDDQTLGYFSIGTPAVPVVLAWLSTKELRARESFSLINTVECHVALGGAKHVAFPVPDTSPFYPLMGKMGYQSQGVYTFFTKAI